jgi:limonene-1,2-epoxide hydrolase
VPRGVAPEQGDNAATVRRLLSALRAADPEATAAELDPEVEAIGQKGSFQGIDQVVGWARPSADGHLYSRVEVDEVREVGTDHVAVDARRQWRWKEGDELAEEERFGVLFELRDGRVYRWRQDFSSVIEAIEAIPAS